MINKNNKNLQLTINKETYKKLIEINKTLNDKNGFKLTKSQIITILINSFSCDQEKHEKTELNNNKIETAQKEIKQIKDPNEWSNKVIAIKEYLNISYNQLANVLNIPSATLKKYTSHRQNPSYEYQNKINNFIEQKNIKI